MNAIIAKVAPLLKDAGFRKRRQTFNRTPEPGLVQVINFQMGSFNPPGPGSEAHAAALKSLGAEGDLYGKFTLNLGIYVEEMVIEDWARRDVWVNEDNCQLRKRIGHLLTGEDVWWSLNSPDDVADAVETALTVAALPWLDRLTTRSAIAEAFDRDGWIALGMSPRAPVEIAFLLKNDRPAKAESLVRSYLAEDLGSGHREWLEPHLRRTGFGHLLATDPS